MSSKREKAKNRVVKEKDDHFGSLKPRFYVGCYNVLL